jgi:putative aldouronate transport system substrate-binding protein
MQLHRRIVVLVTILGLLVTATGFAGGVAADQPPADQPSTAVPEGAPSWQKDTSPFEFDLFFYGAWGGNYVWRDSYVEEIVREKTGAYPNIIIPTGDEKEFLSVMVASGDYPDAMILELTSEIGKRIIEAGQVYPIQELTDQYAPDFWDEIPESIKAYHAQSDGELYQIPSFFSSAEDWQKSTEKHSFRPFFIQRGIYEELGEPSVETPEELFDLLQTIKENYPDLKPFSISPPIDVAQWGFTTSFTLAYLLGAYAPETYGNQYYLEDDEVRICFQSEGMVEAIGFLNRLYRAGILSVDNLTEPHAGWGDDKVSSGVFAVTTRFPIDIWKTHNPAILQITGDPGRTYIPLDYLHVDGQDPQYAGGRGPGWVGSMVMKNAELPGRIIRYLQYSWSEEGQMDTLFGRLGETYEMVNGFPRYTADIVGEMETNTDFWHEYGLERRLLMWRNPYPGWQRMATAPQEFTDYLVYSGQFAADIWDLGLDSLDPDPASREGVSLQRIKDVWNRTVAQMIIAQSDAEFQSALTAGMEEIQESGLDDVLSVMQENHLADLERKGVR